MSVSGNPAGDASRIIGKVAQTTVRTAETEVANRTFRASNALRSAALYLLRGERSGRVYKVPNTRRRYQASAPGESPAVRTGIFRLSWGMNPRMERRGNRYVAVAAIESHVTVGGRPLGERLEKGTNRMAPRPYKQAVVERAMPEIKRIYARPYRL
ncbi:MAG: hypothetical protein FWE80_01900 [Oscillospiraceae bacterium]|nr:hypothetical protein [Oscillospiraceae bacterium]